MKFPVLICDDSRVARNQVAKILSQNTDFEILKASNGEEAWQIIANQEIGLLCLDLTMPVLDGVGLLTKLNQHKKLPHTVVISADIQTQMRERVAQLGAIGFIEKPVSENVLQAILHKFGIY